MKGHGPLQIRLSHMMLFTVAIVKVLSTSFLCSPSEEGVRTPAPGSYAPKGRLRPICHADFCGPLRGSLPQATQPPEARHPPAGPHTGQQLGRRPFCRLLPHNVDWQRSENRWKHVSFTGNSLEQKPRGGGGGPNQPKNLGTKTLILAHI